MVKLLVEADDFGITESTAYGIIRGITEGIIRNTGLFANMPHAEKCAELIRRYRSTGACFGMDFNVVSGRPVSRPEEVPSLVHADGTFIMSGEQMKKMKDYKDPMHMAEVYPYDEVERECRAQVEKFIELTGDKPGYLHGHSLMTPNYWKAVQKMGERYEIPVSMDTLQANHVFQVPCDWTPRPFPVEAQMQTNVEENLMKVLPQILDHEVSAFICHAGFMEEELNQYTTYTMIRTKDLAAMVSPRVRGFLEENHVELITYRDLKEAAK